MSYQRYDRDQKGFINYNSETNQAIESAIQDAKGIYPITFNVVLSDSKLFSSVWITMDSAVRGTAIAIRKSDRTSLPPTAIRKYFEYRYSIHNRYDQYDEQINALINDSIYNAHGIFPVRIRTSRGNVGQIDLMMTGYESGSARVTTSTGRRYTQTIISYDRSQQPQPPPAQHRPPSAQHRPAPQRSRQCSPLPQTVDTKDGKTITRYLRTFPNTRMMVDGRGFERFRIIDNHLWGYDRDQKFKPIYEDLDKRPADRFSLSKTNGGSYTFATYNESNGGVHDSNGCFLFNDRPVILTNDRFENLPTQPQNVRDALRNNNPVKLHGGGESRLTQYMRNKFRFLAIG